MTLSLPLAARVAGGLVIFALGFALGRGHAESFTGVFAAFAAGVLCGAALLAVVLLSGAARGKR